MNIPIKIELPQVWEGTFVKDEWNPINYIVGPNGTGKSLLSNQLYDKLKGKGYRVRLLSAERLSGFEKSNYNYFTSSQLTEGLNISYFSNYKDYGQKYGLSTYSFIILKERLDVKIKIEALLSDLFRKTIRLVEEGGFLKPKIQNIDGGEEYGLKEQECHGMKEIISLLTFLYDDSNDCLIFDEPELHLHPQFQSFFLNEIRKIAGDPKSENGQKLFFIITHSPYFIDIRNLDDLQHILVCHNHQMPTYIKSEDLDEQDKYVLKKFLPRFNTHHKQLFFSPNPVFVEGYTDQQIITLLFEKIGLNIAASGSSVIDVGGKEELAVFYKLCCKLDIKCRIITDYDAFYRGRLRDTICGCNQIQQTFISNALDCDVAKNIGELEKLLTNIADELVTMSSTDSDISILIEKLVELNKEKDKNKNKIRDVVHLSLYKIKDKIIKFIPQKENDIKSFIFKHQKYINCIKSGNIYIIPNGELEHFFIASKVDYLNITQKDKLFEAERDLIMGIDDAEQIKMEYNELLPLLTESIPHINVDMLKHIRFTIMDWVQKVQNAVERREVTDSSTLKYNARVNYALYSQIIECEGFSMQENGSFNCTILIKKGIAGVEKRFSFTDKTTTQDIKFE